MWNPSYFSALHVLIALRMLYMFGGFFISKYGGSKKKAAKEA